MEDRAEVLEPFHQAHGSVVAAWPQSRAEIDAWCGLDQNQIGEEQVGAWAAASDVQAFVFTNRTELLGYGELWIDDEAGEVELAHLIIDPAKRNRSFGQQMVGLLISAARRHHRLVVLRVRVENRAAIACYQRVGFHPASSEEEAAWNVGQPHRYRWMIAGE